MSGDRSCPEGLSRESPKVCEACGHPFLCGGKGCWCAAIVVDTATLAQLRRRYRDCLCERCLREALRRHEPDG